MKKIIFISIFLATISCSPLSFAQVVATVKVYPENPEPKSTVTLTFNSYSFNPSTAMIVWTVNGKKVLEGAGQTTLPLKTGVVGEEMYVTVKASTVDGFETTQAITIAPSSVMILYEAPKSYVPLLYEGRSLPGVGALVRVTALPSMGDRGQLVSSSNLSYSWYINDQLFKAVSGLGKQSALIRLDYLQSENKIKVVVRSPYGNAAEKTISVYTHEVMPILYTHNTILGVDFTKAIQKRFETVKEFTLSLEPFYVTDEDTKRASYSWFLDGLPSTPLGGRLLTLQPKENSYGTKMLSIDVLGTDKLLQRATIRTELIFDTRK